MTGSTHSALAASLLQQAVALHQQGQLAMAQALYRQVLELAPAQFDALHLSGVIARQQGDAQAAIALIEQAIAIDATQAGAHANLGAALQDTGQPALALASYERAIALKPGYALAHSNRGNALRKLGRLDQALDAYDQALQIDPTYAEALCQRAMALQDLGRHEPALAAADQALALRGNYADAWFARGNALQSLRRLPDAIDSYDRALHARPHWAEVYCAQGTALQRLQYFDEALDNYQRAVAIRPDYALAHYYRGNTLRALGRNDDAAAAYRLAQQHGDDPQTIAYALASLGVGDTPATLPGDYVKSLFDQYADHFDQHLLEVLDYQTPALLDQLIRDAIDTGPGTGSGVPGQLDTLDLGCGTGLCGPYLRPLSRTLTGVDLSERMLDKARERGLYDQLVCGDLLPLLSARSAGCDLVVAADVFVYIGDLAPVFAAVSQALRPGGYFCFSVEALESSDKPYALRPSNRYAHTLPYLHQLAEKHGYTIITSQALLTRQENGAHLPAHALLLHRGHI